MSKKYKSKFYDTPIDIVNNWWEVAVTITDCFWRESIYSWYNLVEKNSPSHYINKCLLWGFMQNDIKNVLVIWVWWGAFVKYLEDHIQDIQITGIDIDETMIEIAYNELHIESGDMIVCDVSDVIKILLNRKISYDLILFDVYWWTWDIPQSVVTTELLNKIKLLLKNDWIFSINYSNFYPDSQELVDISVSKYYRSIHENLKGIFWWIFLAFLSGENLWWNVSGIYNLKEKYDLSNIKSRYYNKVQNEEIIFDSKIIEWIYLDNWGNFLR